MSLTSIESNQNTQESKVWEQGVFAPEYHYSEDVFQKKIAENPSVLHEFLVSWLSYLGYDYYILFTTLLIN